MEFTLLIPPIACPRPRIPRFGNPYYPLKYTNWKKEAIRLMKYASYLPAQPIKGRLALFLDMECIVPKSYSKRRYIEALECGVPSGDCDNLAKSAMDLFTSVKLWDDDKQVVDLHVIKRYSDRDAITVSIKRVS